ANLWRLGFMALDLPSRRGSGSPGGGLGRHCARADAPKRASDRRWPSCVTDVCRRVPASQDSLAVDHRHLRWDGLSIFMHVRLDLLDADISPTRSWMVAPGSGADTRVFVFLFWLSRV